MDPKYKKLEKIYQSEPRLRGDGPIQIILGVLYHGRTPLTRGWTHPPVHPVRHPHQNPAYAGMDLDMHRRFEPSTAEPRLRGDGPVSEVTELERLDRTPLTRGWTRYRRPFDLPHRQNPAYAGMDPPKSAPPNDTTSEPRLRGDGPLRRLLRDICACRTPLTRGWTYSDNTRGIIPWQNPAYAGMDPRRHKNGQIYYAEPRLRGDGPFSHLT